MTPMIAMSATAMAATVMASPKRWAEVPRVNTATTISVPSRNTPLKATTKATRSRPTLFPSARREATVFS